jgi:hypothetical protein
MAGRILLAKAGVVMAVLALLLLAAPVMAKVMAEDVPDAAEPGLKLWLRADALSLKSGDAVAAWTASAGSDAVEASAGHGPSFVAAGEARDFNGKPVVRFDGVKKTALLLSGIPKTRTVIIVAKLNSPNPQDATGDSLQALFGADVGQPGNAWNYAGNIPRGYVADPNQRLGDRYWTWHLGVYRYSTNTFDQGVHVSIHEVDPSFDEASNAYTGVYKITSDGDVVFSHPYSPDQADGKLAVLGALGFNGDYSRNVDADVAEVLVYDRILSPNEKSDLQTYLFKKYKPTPAAQK